MTTQWEKDKAKSKDKGFTSTIANAVSKYLNALVDDRQKRRTRWIWELLQNAHDASIASNKRLIASIRDNSEELIFLHNGSGFTIEQIQRLIFHGSTKVEDEETIGRYGSGFLTTHLLSWNIDVSGQLDDGKWFDFRLSRNPESVNGLITSMNQAWDDFNPVSSLREPMPKRFTTRFKYPITEIWAKDAVQEGNTTLKQYAPFVVVFNKAFYSIDINEPREISSFKVVQRCLSIRSGLWEINAIQSINENQTEMKYLLAQGKKASVTVPLRSIIDDRLECLSVENIPRLFVAFPLMGTEPFSFPAVINGNGKFLKPNENRDGVDLGQGNQLDSDTNRNNQAVIKEACALLIRLFQHATSNSWYHAHRWAEVPTIKGNEWLRRCIKEKFIEDILQTPAILTQFDKIIVLKDAVLPLPKSAERIEALWDLLNDWSEYHEKLPRRDEAIGWWKTIRSWANVRETDALKFDGTINGLELALRIKDCSCIEELQSLLQENVCAVEWLSRFYGFLKDDESFDETIRNLHIFPNQTGKLKPLRALHRDKNINKKLKDVDKLLGSTIQNQLCHTELTSLEDEEDFEDWDNEYAVGRLTNTLDNYAKNNNSDDNFKKASALLFAWIVHQKDYTYLPNFPVFAETTNSDEPSIIRLPHPTQRGPQNNELPLAPILSWTNDLQDYSELFPQQHILANAFFDAVRDPDTWQTLEEKGFVRKNVIIHRTRSDVSFDMFLPDEPLVEEKTHKTAEPIIFTNIAFLTKDEIGIMARVRQNQRLARKFWNFLTKWLSVHDAQGVEIIKVSCTCEDKETHYCYRAEWLVPVAKNKWVPQGGGTSDQVKAKSLANLLRGSEWELRSLNENPGAVKLLNAIGVTEFELMREFMAENDDTRNVQDKILTKILAATEGDLNLLNKVEKVVHHVRGNPDVSENLEKLLDATGGELNQIVKEAEELKKQQNRIDENRAFGKQVEKWVKQILKKNLKPKSFSVTPKHTGSDLEILPETFDISTQEIIQNDDKKWLVEVKGTRAQNVKMSFEQTKNALDRKEEFLLCVVPIPKNTQPDFDSVKENIVFIKNIHRKLGDRVAKLCNSIDTQKEVTDKTPDDTSPGIVLDFEKGKAGIRVQESVWKDEGFPLGKLTENLK